MAPRWSKVLRDLRSEPARTALVVLSIAIGLIAFGTILTMRDVLIVELRRSYLATNPASVILTTTAFDNELTHAAARVPGVSAAVGSRRVAARIQLTAGVWQDALLIVVPDDGVVPVGRIDPQQGSWPPAKGTVLIERASLRQNGGTIGSRIVIAVSGQAERTVTLGGTTHDLSLPPAVIASQTFVYLTADTLEYLGGPAGWNQLRISVSGDATDMVQLKATAQRLAALVERSGRPVLQTVVPPPLQHPAEIIIPVLTVMMTVVGLLALVVSAFLSINTITAILSQQTRQIGIMAAVGADPRILAGIYFSTAGCFGLLALLPSIPISIVLSQVLGQFLADQVNIDLSFPVLSPSVLLLQVLAGLLLPIATAYRPIRNATRQPVRELLAGDLGSTPTVNPQLAHIAGALFDRPARLALRNTFRRRPRLLRTLAAMTIGGAVLISVMTIRTSMFATLDVSVADRNYDIEVQLAQAYRSDRVTAVLREDPAVTAIEPTLRASAFPLTDGIGSEEINLRALPAEGSFYRPDLQAGRWLSGNGAAEIVLTSNYLRKMPNTTIGDWLTLRIAGEDSRWQLVGIVREFVAPTAPSLGYVDLPTYQRLHGELGRSDTLRVATSSHDAATHAAVSARLEQRLQAAAIEVRMLRSQTEERRLLDARFELATLVLTFMAVIIGLVGALGLTGTLSMNVLERRREIGMLRAIGADDEAIRRIISEEALTIGLLAWIGGTLLAVPMSFAMSYAFGTALLNSPLIWIYSWPGVMMWLGAVVLIALAASLAPARNATRLTVREVLAYE
jgi:putative ABC transport system permease protein